jgi:hypothetical protein
MITLGQREIDNSNRKIIISDTKYLLVEYLVNLVTWLLG